MTNFSEKNSGSLARNNHGELPLPVVRQYNFTQKLNSLGRFEASKNWLERCFPNQIEKVRNTLELAKLKAISEHEISTFETYSEGQKRAYQGEINSVLEQQQITRDGVTARIVMKEITNLYSFVDNEEKNIMETLQVELENLEKFTHPKLHEMREAQLVSSTESRLERLKQEVDRFITHRIEARYNR